MSLCLAALCPCRPAKSSVCRCSRDWQPVLRALRASPTNASGAGPGPRVLTTLHTSLSDHPCSARLQLESWSQLCGRTCVGAWSLCKVGQARTWLLGRTASRCCGRKAGNDPQELPSIRGASLERLQRPVYGLWCHQPEKASACKMHSCQELLKRALRMSLRATECGSSAWPASAVWSQNLWAPELQLGTTLRELGSPHPLSVLTGSQAPRTDVQHANLSRCRVELGGSRRQPGCRA